MDCFLKTRNNENFILPIYIACMVFSTAKCLSLVLGLAIGAGALPARACIDFAPRVIEDIGQADAVFTGEIIGYERVEPHDGRRYAIMTFRAEKVLKGKIPKEVSIYSSNSTFGIPEHLDLPKTLIVAAVRPENDWLPLRGASATTFPTQRPDLLQLLQAPCAAPFILYGSPENIEDIRTILRGGEVEEHSYNGGTQARIEVREAINRRLAKEARTEQARMILSALAASLCLGTIALVWNARRKRKSV